MKKSAAFVVICISVLGTCFTSYASGWKQDDAGWRWENSDGSSPENCWQWIDGNGDGISEAYCFDENGYMYSGVITPDGYTVNESGAWIVDGTVQTQTESEQTGTASVVTDAAEAFVGNWLKVRYGNSAGGRWDYRDHWEVRISRGENKTLQIQYWESWEAKNQVKWRHKEEEDRILYPVGDGTYVLYKEENNPIHSADQYFAVYDGEMISWWTNRYTTIFDWYEKLN